MRFNNFLNALIMLTFVLTNSSFAEKTSEDPKSKPQPVVNTVETAQSFAMATDGAAKSPEELLSKKVDEEPLKYTLGPDDVIQIDVRRHSEFSGEYPINSEGKIQYKFVGDIPLGGLTKAEAKEKIKNILMKYVIEPDLEITIAQYRSKVIYIVGEVSSPGKYYMKADAISLREAVVQAGLPTLSSAMRRTRLVHPTDKGKHKYEVVDLYGLIYEGKLELDKQMMPGDVLYVPATVFAKVMRVIAPVAAPISPASSIEKAATGGIGTAY